LTGSSFVKSKEKEKKGREEGAELWKKNGGVIESVQQKQFQNIWEEEVRINRGTSIVYWFEEQEIIEKGRGK